MTSPYVSPTLVDTHANLPATATLNHVAIVADDDGAGHSAMYRGTGSVWAAISLAGAIVAAGTNGQVYATVAGAAAWATVAGDVTGAPSAFVVGKVKGTTVTTAGGALTTGQSLRATGVATADWGAVDLANANAITGALPLASVAQGGATTGQALVWNGAAWTPTGVIPGTGTLSTTAPLTGGGSLSSNLTIAIADATTSAVGVIKLAADLRGTGLLPTVIGLTGIANVVEMHGTTIQWDSGVLNPTIMQAPVSGAPTSMTVQAQGSTGSGGGNLTLGGGDGVSVATAGSVAIINGTGQVALLISPTTIQVSRATISFTPTVSSPTINQLPRTAAGVGTPLLVMGQSCTGSATTGANVTFASGLGNAGLGSAAGKVILSWGNVVDALVIDPATDTITSEATTFRWAADVASPAISQITVAGAPASLTIQAQSSTGSGGGNLTLGGGTGVTAGTAGSVAIVNGASVGMTVTPTAINIARTILNFSTDAIINAASAHPIVFQIGGATRAELDPDGVLRIGDALSAVSAPGAGIDLYSVGGRPTMFGSNASAVEVQWQNTVTASAIAGSALLPISPVEFLTLFVNGNFRTIPLYR